ncbi:hypothetical protein CEXT_639531 [Caerostris extrusa]|uniref:Uncharacterized protein n=1 Tax=Caerostris extrusa TaxID=172846 RepID=A0AAV4QRM2_CAEEX|nr:hypothetical protein CEXT_639531 [Caerostris extrusa]
MIPCPNKGHLAGLLLFKKGVPFPKLPWRLVDKLPIRAGSWQSGDICHIFTPGFVVARLRLPLLRSRSGPLDTAFRTRQLCPSVLTPTGGYSDCFWFFYCLPLFC